MSLPTIAMFWDGPPLSFIERLCITSFLEMGHPVEVFSYTGLDNLPEGAKAVSAEEILPNPDSIIRHERTGSAAIHADKFRYHLLTKRPGIIWADTDIYCLKPFQPENGYLFGLENDKVICNAVMALPASSQTLADLVAFCEDEYAIPVWMMPRHRQEMRDRAEAGNPMHVSEMPWGAWGPKALTHYLHNNDEFRHRQDEHVLYPVPYEDRRLFCRPARKTWNRVKDDTISLHFYGRRLRAHLDNSYDGIPPQGSLLAELGEKHGIRP